MEGSSGYVSRTILKYVLSFSIFYFWFHLLCNRKEANCKNNQEAVNGIRADIQEMCAACSRCAEFGRQSSAELMKSMPVPEYPWQLVSQALCVFCGVSYLVTVDNYPYFIGWRVYTCLYCHLQIQGAVLSSWNTCCSYHGQWSAVRQCRLALICHSLFRPTPYVVSLLATRQWKVESAEKVVKSFLKKSDDVHLVLLHYRNTPQQGHVFSPTQRSMGRRTCTILPTAPALLQPSAVLVLDVQAGIAAKWEQSEASYDQHVFGDLPPAEVGEYVYIKPNRSNKSMAWPYGKVIAIPVPRSYVVSTPASPVRRNCAQIHPTALPHLPSLRIQ